MCVAFAPQVSRTPASESKKVTFGLKNNKTAGEATSQLIETRRGLTASQVPDLSDFSFSLCLNKTVHLYSASVSMATDLHWFNLQNIIWLNVEDALNASPVSCLMQSSGRRTAACWSVPTARPECPLTPSRSPSSASWSLRRRHSPPRTGTPLTAAGRAQAPPTDADRRRRISSNCDLWTQTSCWSLCTWKYFYVELPSALPLGVLLKWPFFIFSQIFPALSSVIWKPTADRFGVKKKRIFSGGNGRWSFLMFWRLKFLVFECKV